MPADEASVVVVDAGEGSVADARLTAAGAIRGTVTDATDEPLADVAVEVYDALGAAVTEEVTGADGSYVVGGLAADDYTVCFDASAVGSDYLDQCYDGAAWTGGSIPAGDATPVTVGSGQTVDGVDGRLVRTGGIDGTVTVAGAPTQGQPVTVFAVDGTEVAHAMTGPDGQYAVAGLVPGTYHVCFPALPDPPLDVDDAGVQPACYAGVTWDGRDVPASATGVVVGAGEHAVGVDADLAVAGAVDGSVTGPDDEPVAGVRVLVYDDAGVVGRYAVTDTEGRFRIAGVPAGSYHVCYFASYVPDNGQGGYLSQCYEGIAWDGRTLPTSLPSVDVDEGLVLHDVDAHLERGAAITGTVTSRRGDPVYRAVLVVYHDGDRVTVTSTDRAGRYLVTGLVTGSYQVCAVGSAAMPNASDGSYGARCYEDATYDDGAPGPDAVDVAVVVGQTEQGIELALPAAGAVSGRVVDSAGSPLEQVKVRVFDAGGAGVATISSDAGGDYWLGGLQAGTYAVCFDAAEAGGTPAGYLPACAGDVAWPGAGPMPPEAAVVTIETGHTTALGDVALADGGGIFGTISTPGGEPRPRVMVTVWGTDGTELARTEMDRDGTYRARGLPTGEVVVCVYTDDDALWQATCRPDVVWTDWTRPAPGADPVEVPQAGEVLDGVDMVLTPAAVSAPRPSPLRRRAPTG